MGFSSSSWTQHPTAALAVKWMSFYCWHVLYSGLLPPVHRYPLVKDLRKMLEDAWEKPILPLQNLDFKSSSTSCLKSKGAEQQTGMLPPAAPAGTGAA